MKHQPTPLGQALERLESILDNSAKHSAAIRSMIVAQDAPLSVPAMIAREPVIRDAISESCRAWIESGDLQPMNDQDALYFFDRLHYGETLLRWVLSGDCDCPRKTPAEILNWLVVDSWPLIGVSLWKIDLKSFLP